MKQIFVVTLTLFLIACSDEPGSPVTVNTEGNRYHNAYFGITVDKPEGWYAQSAEETIALQQRGTKALVGDRENMQAMIEASLQSSVPIFGFFEVPPGTPNKLNPNVMSVAENLGGFPGIKDGCDYLQHVRQLMEQGRMAYSFDEGCQTHELHGRSLDYMVGRVKMGDITVTQRYYATMKDQHALAVVQTYFSEEGRKKTMKVVDSIVID